jgi:hypothetical protein
LKAGVWFRRGRLFMVSPVHGDYRRCQAETPLSDLFKFAEPALSNLKAGVPTIRTIVLMEEFFQSLRADLGVSNRGVQQGDFAHLMLKHGELFVAAAKTNPNMTLTELAKLETAVEQSKIPPAT